VAEGEPAHHGINDSLSAAPNSGSKHSFKVFSRPDYARNN